MTRRYDRGVPRYTDWKDRSRTPKRSHWLRRARQLGLRRHTEAEDLTLRGSIAGVAAEVVRLRRSAVLVPPDDEPEMDWLWTITLTGLGLEGRLALAPETTLSRLGKLVRGRDVRTGDPEFDALLLVRGDPRYALAALSHHLRQGIVRALYRGVTFEPDRLSWSFWDRALPRRVLSRVRQVAVLATRLALDDEQVRQALQNNAAHDPLPHVRRRCRALLDEGELTQLRDGAGGLSLADGPTGDLSLIPAAESGLEFAD